MKNTIAVVLFGAVCAAFAWSMQPKPAPAPVTTKPSAPATKTYTQADIDDRELKISTLKAFAERHLRERDEARQERDEARAEATSMSRLLSEYVQKEQAAKAAKSRPVATSSGCASRQTNTRAYTVKRVGPFGRAVYVPSR